MGRGGRIRDSLACDSAAWRFVTCLAECGRLTLEKERSTVQALDMAAHYGRQVRKKSWAALDKLAQRKRPQITRNSKPVGILQPANLGMASAWKNIMAEVWAAQKEAT